MRPPCLPGEAHWWVLESPDGPTVVGRCRKCNASSEWSSAQPETDYRGVPKKRGRKSNAELRARAEAAAESA